MDGDHRAWIVVEGETKDEATNTPPPVYRHTARIVGLSEFPLEEVDELVKGHTS